MSGRTLEKGVRGEAELTVTPAHTAAALESGCLAVLGTPAMIALMERCAETSVCAYLDVGCSTVGTHIDVRHVSATPVGAQVRCETELTEVDGRRLTFACRAFDSAGLIGEGAQERVVVQNDLFLHKAEAKREEQR